VGGNAEQVFWTELGRIVPDGDQAALARAMIEALSRDWNRALIAAHGGRRTWSDAADEVHAVFARVLASRAVSDETGRGPVHLSPSVEPVMEGTL
jgi:hypothetical protein